MTPKIIVPTIIGHEPVAANFRILRLPALLRLCVRFSNLCSLACCFFFCFSATAHGAADIQIITAAESGALAQIAATIHQAFPRATINTQPRNGGKGTTYLAIGPAALKNLVTANPPGLIVSLFSSGQTYHQLTDKASGSRAFAVTGIYSDPAPANQLKLILLLYKTKVSLASLTTDQSAYAIPALHRAETDYSYPISIYRSTAADDTTRALDAVAKASVVLALPDNTLFNSDSLRDILITSYRRNQAVIGFSRAMVKAGALASTYSSVSDIIAQLQDMLAEVETRGNVPDPQYPKYFESVINLDVAKSLNILVDAEAQNFQRKPGGKR